MSGGLVSFAGTDWQQREKIQDSDELYLKDLMVTGEWKNDETLVQVFIGKQRDTFYWLSKLGVQWLRLILGGGMTVPRAHKTDPVKLVGVLKEAAETRGARILFKTRVKQLLTDEAKSIVGVSAESAAGNLHIKARKGVVLATGGFGWDTKRLEAIDPRLAKVMVIMGAGNSGDGLRMAEELGAGLRDMKTEYLKPAFGMHVANKSTAAILLIWWCGGILVNKRGKRFVNESLDIRSLGVASLNQPEGIAYDIFDQKILDKEQQEGYGLPEPIAKLLVEAQTIEELSAKIGVPGDVFRETIDKYNAGVEKGRGDEFGRTALARNVGKPIKIDTPPFYAYEARAFIPATYGGLVVDAGMHVLGAQGRIPGLYAAGEVVGGFHGAGYQTGTALAKAIVFGRIAGRNVARQQ